jgi:hypothetical protein
MKDDPQADRATDEQDEDRCCEALFGRDRCDREAGHEGFHEAVRRYTNGFGHDVVEEISWL